MVGYMLIQPLHTGIIVAGSARIYKSSLRGAARLLPGAARRSAAVRGKPSPAPGAAKRKTRTAWARLRGGSQEGREGQAPSSTDRGDVHGRALTISTLSHTWNTPWAKLYRMCIRSRLSSFCKVSGPRTAYKTKRGCE